ncbi:hypothetical protein B0H14DRAFT_2582566 [Mycena olivaceomarginata]|nr:hypothetical protein B0H14DRAFT_2582566 [Mycena olivaceomarginata]
MTRPRRAAVALARRRPKFKYAPCTSVGERFQKSEKEVVLDLKYCYALSNYRRIWHQKSLIPDEVCLAKERITTDEPQRRYTLFTKDCEQNLRAGGILKSIVGNG